MREMLESKFGRENRTYIGTRSVFSCHVETVPSFNLLENEEKRSV